MNPVKNHLVALGSAAVLTVYSAGFLRTKSAADRFAAADVERGRAVAATDHIPAPAPELPGGAQTGAPLPVAEQAAPAHVSPLATKPAAGNKPSDTVVAPPPPPSQPASATTTAINSTAAALAKLDDSTLVPQVVAPAPTAVAPPVTTQSTATSSSNDATSAAKDRGPYKDGTYSGWGTSRHGDIQASVEIRDGRIASAWISQCLTRYPCSRIASLIPEVAARQTANVDYISGATQSSNAFYYAVAEALSHAK